jgi:hypothetical protein
VVAEVTLLLVELEELAEAKVVALVLLDKLLRLLAQAEELVETIHSFNLEQVLKD